MLGRVAALSIAMLAVVAPAMAQDGEVETFPFAGGELTITQTPDFEKVLAFDGEELARDYFVFFDRIDAVSGTDVAFVYVGSGGNACAPAVAMVWKPEDGEVRADLSGEDDCGSPPPAISDNAVYFVPWLLPGQSAQVRAWSPEEGFRLHGQINYAPEPDTTWADLDGMTITHPLDFFRNAAIHAAAQALLGDDLEDVAASLGTASEPGKGEDGIWTGTGCVPHACGVADGFIAVDPANEALYFAQQGGDGGAAFWPPREAWPSGVAAALPSSF